MLGATRDDAAGEAYDKVAKMLDLGYPGGPVIDRLARAGDPGSFHFPRARLKQRPKDRHRRRFDFSFSGLKTAVWQFLGDHPDRSDAFVADVVASFQAAVVDMLVDTASAATEATGVDRLVIAGGVSANSALRRRAAGWAKDRDIDLFVPAPSLCTDNAAMIAWAASRRLARGESDPLTMNAVADLDL